MLINYYYIMLSVYIALYSKHKIRQIPDPKSLQSDIQQTKQQESGLGNWQRYKAKMCHRVV